MPRTPSKRKHQATEDSTSQQKVQSNANDANASVSLRIVAELKALAKDSKRVSNVYEGFMNGKFMAEAARDESVDCCWIILGTHTVNRLLVITSKQPEPIHAVIASICLSMATIFYKERFKLERLINATSNKLVKSIIARAISTIIMASMQILQRPCRNRRVLWASMLSIFSTVFLLPTEPTSTSAIWDDVSSLEVTNVDRALKPKPEEQECLSQLLTAKDNATEKEGASKPAATSSGPSPAKRGRRPKKEPSSLYVACGALLNTVVDIDTRLPMRKWAPSVFIWFSQGQEKGLEICQDVLSNDHVLDCPPSQPASTGAGGTRSKESPVTFYMPANVAAVTFCCRMLEVICEAGANCATKLPTCGFDSYALGLLYPKRKSAKVQTLFQRNDIRDLTVVTIHRLIRAHLQCLEEHVGEGCVTNDTEEDTDNASSAANRSNLSCFAKSDDGSLCTVNYCPTLHKVLEKLPEVVSTASTQNKTMAATSIRALRAITAAFVFQGLTQTMVVDAKLCILAASRFTSTVPTESSSSKSQDWPKRFQELKPLSEPELKKQTKSRRGKKRDDAHCTFGGMFSGDAGSVSDQELFIFLCSSFANGEAPVGNLFSLLFGVLECVYGVTNADNKKKNKDSTEPPRKKQKKQASVSAKQEVTQQDPLSPSGRLNSIRSALTIDVLNGFQKLLARQAQPHIAGLQEFCRKSLSTALICRFVQLNKALDAMMRIPTKLEEPKIKNSPSFFLRPSDYNAVERSLWVAHTKLCAAIGSGVTPNTPDKGKRPPFSPLGDENGRLKVFESVLGGNAEENESWPLCLSSLHHALLTTNLAFEPIGTDPKAERFVSEAMLRSISQALENPKMLCFEVWNKIKDMNDLDKIMTCERIPLSLRDARLLLLSIVRLKAEERVAISRRYLDMLSRALDSFINDESRGALLIENKEISGFVARNITVCMTLVSLLSGCEQIRGKLFQFMDSVQYQLPQLLSLKDIKDSYSTGEDWYKREACYMGLFSDWESSVLPAAASPNNFEKPPPDVVAKANQIIENGLRLGFKCAQPDGHLLFAAWNAAGRRRCFDQTETPASELLPDVTQIIQMRERICGIHNDYFGDRMAPADSLLSQIVSKNRGSTRANRAANLQAMVSHAEALVKQFTESDKEKKWSTSQLALLESLVVYISSLISISTSPGDSVQAALTRRKPKTRKRQNANGQEEGPEIIAAAISDDDSFGSDCYLGDDGATLDTLARLHDVCCQIGAAPLHPDWLDHSCQLQDGISKQRAFENATVALRCFNAISDVAHKNYVGCLNRCMTFLAGFEEPNEITRRGLVLCTSAQLIRGLFSLDENDEALLAKSIAKMCGISESVIAFTIKHRSSLSTNCAEGAWAFNSSQRLVGILQDNVMEGIQSSHSEYRACGEWELMFAKCVAGACLMIDADDDEVPKEVFDDLRKSTSFFVEAKAAMTESCRWRRLIKLLVSNSAPVTALVRFCVSGGFGRAAHPMAKRLLINEEDMLLASTHVHENFPPNSSPMEADIKTLLVNFISFASSVSSRDPDDESLSRSSMATVSNILVDSSSYAEIEAQSRISLSMGALSAIMKTLNSVGANDPEFVRAALGLVDRLVSCISFLGKSEGKEEPSVPNRDVFRLTTFLDDRYEMKAKSKEELVLPKSALSYDGGTGEHLVTAFVDVIVYCGNQPEWGEALTKSCLILANLVQNEFHGSTCGNGSSVIRSTLLDTILAMETTRNHQLIEMMISSKIEGASGHLSKFFAFLLTCPDTGKVNALCDKIMVAFEKNIKDSKSATKNPCALRVLFVVACKVQKLHVICRDMFENLQAAGTNEAHISSGSQLECVEELLKFMTFLSSRSSEEKPSSSQMLEPKKADQKTNLKVQTSCSFVSKSGFHNQHWYYCYTCGFVFDKGCCTLCALTCHRGHDVAYSRYSSFFCDCGAEMPVPGDSRTPCKCLSPIPHNEAEKLYREEMSKSYLWSDSESTKKGSQSSNEEEGKVIKTVMDVVVPNANASYDSVKQEIQGGNWIGFFFRSLQQNLEGEGEYVRVRFTEKQRRSAPVGIAILRKRLEQRWGKAMALERIEKKVLVPICSSRANSFHVKVSSDSTTDRIKKSILSRQHIARSVMAADSRGRLIVAETGQLVFCSAFPIANGKFAAESRLQLGRANLSVIGSSPVKLDVVGLSLCEDNERHLLLWGTSEISVAIIHERGDSVETFITIPLGLDAQDSNNDVIMKCVWVPSSQTCFAVVCRTFVKFFTLGKSKAVPMVSYAVGYDVLIRDACMALLPPKRGSDIARSLYLYLLMETGKIHKFSPRVDGGGNAVESGTVFLEQSKHVFDFPGGKTQKKNEESHVGSTGDSRLVYLSKSGIMLYKCGTGGVTAVNISHDGEFSGSFEFLPESVASEIIESDGYDITGPFLHWRELGITPDGSFRILCVGKSSRSGQPKILCVELSQNHTRVQEIAFCLRGSVGIGVSLFSSYEGLSVVTAPMISAGKFRETVYLCAITSCGSLIVFGEDLPGKGGIIMGEEVAQLESAPIVYKEPSSFAITIFEMLYNISDAEELIVSGDLKGSDTESLKALLASKSCVCMASRSGEGGTLTLSLSGPVNLRRLKEQHDEAVPDIALGTRAMESRSVGSKTELVIVAIRVHVGTTSLQCIPKYLAVEGRCVSLSQDVKRWYDIPLSKEELLLSVRNGFVAVGVGPPFEAGRNSILDAIEVYAIDRTKVAKLIPTQLVGLEKETVGNGTESAEEHRGVVLNVRILSHLSKMLKLDSKALQNSVISRLLEVTALHDSSNAVRRSAVDLVESVGHGDQSWRNMMDLATIKGLLTVLAKIQNNISSPNQKTGTSDTTDTDNVLFERVLTVGLEIFESRPSSYIGATQTLLQSEQSNHSVAVGAFTILGQMLRKGAVLDRAVATTVELMLSEISITVKINSLVGSFASFDMLMQLLKTSDQRIIRQTSDAITAFVQRKSERPTISNPIAEYFHRGLQSDRPESTAPIAYQCDSCGIFPITDSRYTLLDKDYDIDLCVKCFEIGRGYAARLAFPSNVQVVINGRTIGATTKLTCAQISEMEPVPISDGHAIVQHVEQAKKEMIAGVMKNVGGLVEPLRDEGTDYDTFIKLLFTKILDLVRSTLTEREIRLPEIANINPLLLILLRATRIGKSEGLHIDRAKRLTSMILEQIKPLLLQSSTQKTPQVYKVLMINLLRCLCRLIGERGGTGDSNMSKSRGNNSSFKGAKDGDVPSTAPKQKNISHMTDGDKEATKEKAPKSPASEDAQESPYHIKSELESLIWSLLNETSEKHAQSLGGQLCDLLRQEMFVPSNDNASPGQCVRPQVVQVNESGGAEDDDTNARMPSHYTKSVAQRDLADGVFCSHERLSSESNRWMIEESIARAPQLLLLPDGNTNHSLIEAVLDLISLVASTGDQSSTESWFSLLCRIMSINSCSGFRSQAKKALKRMCGGNHGLYHAIRDHYVFGFQFRQLLWHANGALNGALGVRNQARQCGDNWAKDELTWKDISVGALLGTSYLISEDSLAVDRTKDVGQILAELLSVARIRNGNWRNFCSLPHLPDGLDESSPQVGPPIKSLFWLACSLRGPNQVKTMQLVDLALTTEENEKKAHHISSNRMQLDDETASARKGEQHLGNSFPFSDITVFPEETLIATEKGLTNEEIFSFAIQFVLKGRTSELRSISSKAVQKLCRYLKPDLFCELFSRLVHGPLNEVSSKGSAYTQYLQLLQGLSHLIMSKGPMDISAIVATATKCFMEEMSLFRLSMGKVSASIESAGNGKDPHKRRFDLSNCVHCHRVHPNPPKASSKSSHRASKSTDASGRENDKSDVPDNHPWLLEQVRPFVRGKLETSTDASASSEFSIYIQLKCRLSIFAVQLSIDDPRGRYVKKIGVSFTPRHVVDVSQLKSEDYKSLWQRVGTFTLARGATKASCKLDVPVTAANLKFDYLEFYERPGGSRNSDGSIIVHCPRCTRVVNNAHYVCGHCGEVAFQCRRCRHINYDRLDAFLCVECGYCSSGSFSYDLTAGVASNAVAITDDESYNRSLKVLKVASKLHSELKGALREKVRRLAGKRGKRDESDPFEQYNQEFKMALQGELPAIGQSSSSTSQRRSTSLLADDNGSRVSSLASRSFLRFARQLRNESSSFDNQEAQMRDAILGGRGLPWDDIEDPDQDIVGLIESNRDRADSTDPISRLVASIQGRCTERSNNSTGANLPRASLKSRKGKSRRESANAQKHMAEECSKLYQLFREAERECYELNERISAWVRLENDSLLEDENYHLSDIPFRPTRCGKCWGTVTLHFLLFFLRLCQANMKGVEPMLTKEFIQALFFENGQMQKDLIELKRLVITTLCTSSETGAGLILEELRIRLGATQDTISAVVLGKLLETDFAMTDAFVELATKTLNEG